MAEGFLRSFDPKIKAYSAGTEPSGEVHPKAVKVMNEAGIDIGKQSPKHVRQFIQDPFDYVITVCDNAKESCPLFTGEVKQRLHMGFEDPAVATGTEEEINNVFRSVRDQIKEAFYDLYEREMKG
jgi:arsenate reductase